MKVKNIPSKKTKTKILLLSRSVLQPLLNEILHHYLMILSNNSEPHEGMKSTSNGTCVGKYKRPYNVFPCLISSKTKSV